MRKEFKGAFYPHWICDICAYKAGGTAGGDHFATFHMGTCQSCWTTGAVTEARDWDYPEFPVSIRRDLSYIRQVLGELEVLEEVASPQLRGLVDTVENMITHSEVYEDESRREWPINKETYGADHD